MGVVAGTEVVIYQMVLYSECVVLATIGSLMPLSNSVDYNANTPETFELSIRHEIVPMFQMKL
jgi:hypothetical protein